MAEQSEQNTTQEQSQGSSTGSTALKAAAAAAAAGTAAVMARKAFSGHGGSNGSNGNQNGSSQKSGERSTALSSIASGGWDAARDALLPAAEDAAGAAGTFLAENGPEVLRERILPRFVESFNEARNG